MTDNGAIPPFSHPKTTEKVLDLLEPEKLAGARVLDLGAGAGYFSQKLSERLEAAELDPEQILTPCDLFPEQFQFTRLTCVGADFSDRLPFDDGMFDAVVCMEVIEHLHDQLQLWREIARIVKPGGRAIVTTPNILNANSRLRYLFTGTMPLYDILPITDNDVVHTTGHVGPVGLYYLFFQAKLAGFREARFHVDRSKRSAAVAAPFVWAAARVGDAVLQGKRRKLPYLEENRPALEAMNSWRILVGRTVIVDAKR